jgi:hypothetical protein
MVPDLGPGSSFPVARAATGHAAAPPTSVMNSRRFMLSMALRFLSVVPLVAGRVRRWRSGWNADQQKHD